MSESNDRKRAAKDLVVNTVQEDDPCDFGEFGDAVESPAYRDSFGTSQAGDHPGSAPSKRTFGVTDRQSLESTKSAPGAFNQEITKLAGKSDPFTSVVFVSQRDMEMDRWCRGIIGDTGAKFCLKKRSDCSVAAHKGKKHHVRKESLYIQVVGQTTSAYCRPALLRASLKSGETVSELMGSQRSVMV
jgi:hypothetical protein